MVCPETYKNEEKKWPYQGEGEKKEDGNFITKKNKKKVVVGPSEGKRKRDGREREVKSGGEVRQKKKRVIYTCGENRLFTKREPC